MRNEILQLKDLGRMPNESINDTESIDELVNTYDALLEQIQLPISFDEAMVLVQIFPENAFYDLQWSLLKLVESVCCLLYTSPSPRDRQKSRMPSSA